MAFSSANPTQFAASLTGGHVPGSSLPSGALQSALRFALQQLEEIMGLVYALGALVTSGETRGKNYRGHLYTRALTNSECLERTDCAFLAVVSNV